jgi:photosystem II stability/assembly factor-like uncharacterized protein
LSKIVQFLLAITFLLAAPGQARGADWHLIRMANHENFEGLHFIDETRGFIVTNKGNILTIQESDSGWTARSLPVHNSLENICFTPDGKAGFAFGSDGIIFKTEDSGRTWSSDTLRSNARLRDMAFFDPLRGVLIGEFLTRDKGTKGVTYITADGGRNWNQIDIEGWRFNCVDASPQGTAVIIGIRRIFVSHDYGTTWSIIHLPGKTVPEAAAIRDNNGIIVGKSGFLSLSDNRGASWNEKQIISWRINMSGLLMIDSLRAYAVGSTGEILYTDDAGLNWIPEPSGTAENLNDIHMAGNRIFVCGRNGALTYTELK